MLRRFGYKATFMLGLTLYGVGALMFWPAGLKRSFGVCLLIGEELRTPHNSILLFNSPELFH